MKKNGILLLMISIMAAMLMSCSLWTDTKDQTTGNPESEDTDNKILVGFSQLGAESDWRSANTESMRATFTSENGYELIIEDGQQKQANQITAIRSFIQQEVDYIVLAPVTETGWDTVLQEAKDAGIPVIIVDRMVNVSDTSLFTCWVGSDFELEARKATEWLRMFSDIKDISPEDIHIVNIQGTMDGSAQIGRTKGLEDAVAEYGWDLLEEMSGEFTQAKGREVMEYFLNKYDNINVVYCENDNEALGALEAIEAAGRTVGSDIAAGEIMVMSFDGVGRTAMEYALEGKITCIMECNPLHGPRVRTIIETLEDGGGLNKFEYVDESIFSADNSIKEICVDGTIYPVTILNEAMVEKRLQSY